MVHYDERSEDAASFASDSDFSASDELGSSKSTDLSPAKPRDEVREIEKASKKDTNWIKIWRFLLIVTLGGTATAVTLVTFRFLEDEQDQTYKASVSVKRNSPKRFVGSPDWAISI